MADIKFSCTHCEQHLEAPREMTGDTVDCPSCSTTITVPDSSPTPENEEPTVHHAAESEPEREQQVGQKAPLVPVPSSGKRSKLWLGLVVGGIGLVVSTVAVTLLLSRPPQPPASNAASPPTATSSLMSQEDVQAMREADRREYEAQQRASLRAEEERRRKRDAEQKKYDAQRKARLNAEEERRRKREKEKEAQRRERTQEAKDCAATLFPSISLAPKIQTTPQINKHLSGTPRLIGPRLDTLSTCLDAKDWLGVVNWTQPNSPCSTFADVSKIDIESAYNSITKYYSFFIFIPMKVIAFEDVEPAQPITRWPVLIRRSTGDISFDVVRPSLHPDRTGYLCKYRLMDGDVIVHLDAPERKTSSPMSFTTHTDRLLRSDLNPKSPNASLYKARQRLRSKVRIGELSQSEADVKFQALLEREWRKLPKLLATGKQ